MVDRLELTLYLALRLCFRPQLQEPDDVIVLDPISIRAKAVGAQPLSFDWLNDLVAVFVLTGFIAPLVGREPPERGSVFLHGALEEVKVGLRV